nr:hypothetical protein [Mycobacterium heckeshornense]
MTAYYRDDQITTRAVLAFAPAVGACADSSVAPATWALVHSRIQPAGSSAQSLTSLDANEARWYLDDEIAKRKAARG